MRAVKFPCLQTRMAPRNQIVANNWNPNTVSPDKMELLKQSIIDNGWCFPIVVIHDAEADVFVIVDGFHRWTIAQPEWLDLPEVPIVVLSHTIVQRMIATVQFNKARGVHQVDLDAELIRGLIEQGMSDEQISTHLGIDMDTVHRYKQVTGIAELFKDAEYSTSWQMVDD
jgi:ParB-like chromosome segregation protein Spo0J